VQRGSNQASTNHEFRKLTFEEADANRKVSFLNLRLANTRFENFSEQKIANFINTIFK